jgi:hypothetical protein
LCSGHRWRFLKIIQTDFYGSRWLLGNLHELCGVPAGWRIERHDLKRSVIYSFLRPYLLDLKLIWHFKID